jgi:hypothetical protein
MDEWESRMSHISIKGWPRFCARDEWIQTNAQIKIQLGQDTDQIETKDWLSRVPDQTGIPGSRKRPYLPNRGML